MSESGDYDPGPWSGHDFTAARVTYDKHAGRSYDAAVAAKKTSTDLLPVDMETDSPSPLAIVVDETGSMGKWPAIMFSKLPYLEHEAKVYLGKNTKISFAAIGDAYNNEKYPLQGRPFDEGQTLLDRLKELVIEGGGGGTMHETYELAALYYARNVKMPKAKKGVIIFIGDEMVYDTISPAIAKAYAHVELEKDINTKDVFKELAKKFSVYAIIKPFDGGVETLSVNTQQVYTSWCNLIGETHVALLPAAERVVDVIFGILAEEKNRFAEYMAEIEDRQKDDKTKVDVVYKSLKTVHDFDKYPKWGDSQTSAKPGASTLHISLDDDSEGDDLA